MSVNFLDMLTYMRDEFTKYTAVHKTRVNPSRQATSYNLHMCVNTNIPITSYRVAWKYCPVQEIMYLTW